jgi:hypothetical protein
VDRQRLVRLSGAGAEPHARISPFSTYGALGSLQERFRQPAMESSQRSRRPPKLESFNALHQAANFFERQMARLDGETSNELFETLAEWNAVLEHRKPSGFQVPPCP